MVDQSQDTSTPRVLVVDDEESIRELLGKKFPEWGYEPVFASNGAEADGCLEQGNGFSLYMVDVMLPGGENGLVVANKIANHPGRGGARMIVMSGRFEKSKLDKVRDAFPNTEVLAKPFELKELQAIAEACRPKEGIHNAPPDAAYLIDVNHDEGIARFIIATSSDIDGVVEHEADAAEALKAEEVYFGLDEETLENAFHQGPVEFDKEGAIVVARGRDPVHGKDGVAEFQFDTSGRAFYRGAEDAEDDEQDTVDFRSATRFECVKEGDVLAVLTEPTPGQEGVSLRGNSIQARDGKPARLHYGDGVEMQDERTYVATRVGRPLLRAGVLVVSPELHVEGDVDLSVGNIDFEGHVTVDGNVIDGMTVRADTLDVMGAVGAATIDCEGHINIGGGVNGQGRAKIDCGGELFAKYINQAKVTVQGKITVRREIVNCRVWCHDRVMSGKILGGECIALGGVDVAVAGSDMGVKTILEPGADFEIRQIDLELAEVHREIEKLIRPVENFLGDRARFKGLPAEKQNEFRAIYTDFQILHERHRTLMANRRDLIDEDSCEPVKTVLVRKLLYPDVLMKTDLCMRQFTTEAKGPLLLVEDVNNATIVPKPPPREMLAGPVDM